MGPEKSKEFWEVSVNEKYLMSNARTSNKSLLILVTNMLCWLRWVGAARFQHRKETLVTCFARLRIHLFCLADQQLQRPKGAPVTISAWVRNEVARPQRPN